MPNGIDDNCDGTVDNAAPPSGAHRAARGRCSGNGAAHLTWNAAATATGYDLVTGSLQILQSSGGSFSAATTQCLANDLPTTSFDDSRDSGGGPGLLVRAPRRELRRQRQLRLRLPSQVGSRDAEIAASGHGCP